MTQSALDVLAVGPHPDDVELLCGGTLARCADQGHRTRAAEAERAAEILGVEARLNAGLPDAGIFNTDHTRARLVDLLRELRPRVVILPYYRGRHPDHRMAAELTRDACFLAGLKKYGGRAKPHRPDKILYALSFREDPVKPTFVVNIEAQFARKVEAIRCYASQFEGVIQAGEAFPTGQTFSELVETQNRHYGSLIRCGFGEPFFTEETVEIDDIATMSVGSL
jgi:bacillithiol biosynthesis deacetylase BshB1